ncbi:MAG: hypothetical protein KatS3mg088_308 [Patescibacteria group bacterium]|nr:MAG: hypothetical protein KatS3mg088_308 [Patescibacteria group bacterium]
MTDQINLRTKEFQREISLAFKLKASQSKVEEPLTTTKTASTLAVIYESARNAVEFRADHLIRQAAIERILKRRLFLNQKSKKLSELLIKELLWARYLKPESIPSSKVDEVSKIIDKYRFLLSYVGVNGSGKDDLAKRILEIASCEIEERLVFDPLSQVIINYVFETFLERFDFEERNPKVKSIQIYIAVEKGFGKNNDGLISYKLLKTLIPSWFSDDVEVERLRGEFLENLEFVKLQLDYPLGAALRKEVIRLSAPFNLLREMIDTYQEDFIDLISDKKVLNSAIESVLNGLYQETRDKLSRASVRSIIYIFLTKMIIGILLELPVDLLLGRLNLLALGINLGFPPLLMFLLNLDINIPGNKNTEMIVEAIDDYFYSQDKPEVKFLSSGDKKQKVQRIFWFFYLFMFVVTFGGVIWLLTKLGFNPVSQLIFIFFLSVVSFFAYRVRGIAKEFSLEAADTESLISSFKDFLFLPIIKVGQWLSAKIASFNLLSFVLDFIIEAPLKVFLEVIEEWIHFIKAKKEEIVS